ncbi:MAG: phage integrase N-terminal SAM-like domain-containing protein [Deltaproteobacteria bacterium]|nr:phage integrase N-terminal SAM-like domain-containing protein [Deltaproteobacteria bacterium]
MVIRRSRTRTVVTLAEGMFEAKEVLKQCAGKTICPTVGSSALAKLVKPRQRYGYDLVVHVGVARYLGGKQRDEIRVELHAERGIDLSAGTISNLCDRFLVLFERLHVYRAPALRAAMEGSYPLHLDATCERGRGGLFVTMDGWKRWVLWAARIPTEHGDHLRPVVEKTVELFGLPIAMVHDMGKAMSASVGLLRQQGIPDFVCHYHFLAAVGQKLLDQSYTLLQNVLRQCGTRGSLYPVLRELRCYHGNKNYEGDFRNGNVREELLALLLWLIEGTGKKNPPFPFALPHFDFLKRCQQAPQRVDQWIPFPRTESERRAIHHVLSLVKRPERDPRLTQITKQLNQGWQAFSELRDLLRLGSDELPRGERGRRKIEHPDLELQRLRQIEQDLISYKAELLARIGATDRNCPSAIILGYLKRYGARLFQHPVRRDEDGAVLDIVERTNNVLECYFGDEKQKLRRRVGRAHLGRDLQQQPAQAALVSNLSRSDYVQVLCGSLDNLPAALAALDGIHIEGTTPLVRDHRDSKLQRRIQQLLEGVALDDGPQADISSSPADSRHSAESADFTGLSEQELRARCTKVFGGADLISMVADKQSTRTKKTIPANTRASTPLGKLDQRMTAELKNVGYSTSSRYAFLAFARGFSSFHKRSPLNLGNNHVMAYLRHLVFDKNVLLPGYRNARTSLMFLYEVILLRPEEVEQLPRTPAELFEAAPEHEPSPGSWAGAPLSTRPAELGDATAPVS